MLQNFWQTVWKVGNWDMGCLDFFHQHSWFWPGFWCFLCQPSPVFDAPNVVFLLLPKFANGFELELVLFQVDVGGWKSNWRWILRCADVNGKHSTLRNGKQIFWNPCTWYIMNFRYQFQHSKNDCEILWIHSLFCGSIGDFLHYMLLCLESLFTPICSRGIHIQ